MMKNLLFILLCICGGTAFPHNSTYYPKEFKFQFTDFNQEPVSLELDSLSIESEKLEMVLQSVISSLDTIEGKFVTCYYLSIIKCTDGIRMWLVGDAIYTFRDTATFYGFFCLSGKTFFVQGDSQIVQEQLKRLFSKTGASRLFSEPNYTEMMKNNIFPLFIENPEWLYKIDENAINLERTHGVESYQRKKKRNDN